MTDDIKEQLDRIESSSKRIEQAVFGDDRIGLPGLVHDMNEQKQWRGKLLLKAATAGGLVSGAVLGGKALLAKILN